MQVLLEFLNVFQKKNDFTLGSRKLWWQFLSTFLTFIDCKHCQHKEIILGKYNQELSLKNMSCTWETWPEHTESAAQIGIYLFIHLPGLVGPTRSSKWRVSSSLEAWFLCLRPAARPQIGRSTGRATSTSWVISAKRITSYGTHNKGLLYSTL